MPNDFDVIEDGLAPGTIPDNPAASPAPAPVAQAPVQDPPPTPSELPTPIPEPAPAPVVPPPTPEKFSPGVQKRIDRLTREKYDLQAQLEAVRRANPQAPAPAQLTQPTAPVDEPKEEDFKTYTEFIDARADWRYAKNEQARIARESAQRVQTEQDVNYSQFRARELKVMEQHPEYDDVADAKTLAAQGGLNNTMVAMINASPVGPDLLLHLGANVEEARKIAAMPPVQAARALFKLESTFDGVTESLPVRVTGAPEPITPLTSHPPTNPTNRMDGMEMY